MKNFFIICLLSCFSSFCYGAEAILVQLLPVNLEARFERSTDQEMVTRRPLNLAVGVRWKKVSTLFEYTQFSDQTGNSTLGVKRELQTNLAWGRIHFYGQEQNLMDFSFFGGGAIGAYRESVMTTFNGVSQNDPGNYNLASGISLGTDMAVHLTGSLSILTAIEARVIFGQDLDPNPQAGGVFRIGLQF